MTGVTSHVLDTSRGTPAAGVRVTLAVEGRGTDDWREIASRSTDADGRTGNFLGEGDPIVPGIYRLRFDLEAYHDGAGFYPYADVVFTIHDADGHYHVPLLVSAFGYSTYRGS